MEDNNGISALYRRFPGINKIKLTPQQLDAVTEITRPALVLAVPGSGKTTVLVMRLGYMIYCRGIDPREILTLTYTVAAAEDMRRRFASFFGEEDAGRLEFRTINGICAKILLSFERHTGRHPFDLLTDEKQSSELLTAILRKYTGGFPGEGDRMELQRKITCAKNMMLTQEEINGQGDRAYPFGEMYKAYCGELKSRRLMDYDDQLVYALSVLRGFPAVLNEFSSRFRYISVDEAQDTSKIQHEIISLLAGKSGILFMVGDEDQSIYGFRAAYPEALLDFENRRKNARVMYLERNFRSDGYIVGAADSFIEKNILRHRKRMTAEHGSGCDISCVMFKNRVNQYDYIAGLARDCTEETAVLFRDNETAVPVIDRLERAGITYNLKKDNTAFFSNRIVRDVRDIIAFAFDPCDTQVFSRIYFQLGTYLSRQNCAAACALSVKTGIPVLDAALKLEGVSRGTAQKCTEVKNALYELKKARGSEIISIISYGLSYREYLTKTGMRADKLTTLSAISAGLDSAPELPERLDGLERIIINHVNTPDCKFTLSTIHSSKGLEYDSVYLCDVFDGVFPESQPAPVSPAGYKRMKPEERMEYGEYEEARRIFYVGMTRAKKKLTAFAYKNAPSCFVNEICPPYRAVPGPDAVKTAPGSRTAEPGLNGFIAAHPPGSVMRHKKLGELSVVRWNGSIVRVMTARGEMKELDAAVLLSAGLTE